MIYRFFFITLIAGIWLFTSTGAGAEPPSPDITWQIQEKLADRGYHPGPIDGVWGRGTSSELRRFQLDNRLPPTGSPNPPTLQKLGIEPPPPDITRQIQEKLTDRGYHPGPIDGVWGPGTSSELRRFQLDNRLPPSGSPNPQTLERLGIEPADRPPGPPPGPPPPPSNY